jgi:NAD(P)H dehydrogenase (quinone)
MKIGVSGAGGKLGSTVLDELAKRAGGHTIVGISRAPATIPPPFEGRRGDYDEPASLATAYKGLDRLLLIPSADLRPGVRGGQLKAAIDAAKQAGVSHVVLMSAAGTREAPDTELGGAYWAGEQHLIKTARHWTILRMNYYAQSMAEEIQMSLGMNVLSGVGDERVAYVSRDDLAAAAAGVLVGDGHAGAIYNGTGPAIVSGPEKAAIVSDILGKPLSYAVITEDQLRAGLTQAGLPLFVIDAVAEIKRTFVRGYFDILTSDIERLSGRAPKSFRDVVRATLSKGGAQ